MLWFDGKGVTHFKTSSTGVAEDTQSANGDINKVDRFKLLLEFGYRRNNKMIIEMRNNDNILVAVFVGVNFGIRRFSEAESYKKSLTVF